MKKQLRAETTVWLEKLNTNVEQPPPSSHFLAFTPAYHALTVGIPGVKRAWRGNERESGLFWLLSLLANGNIFDALPVEKIFRSLCPPQHQKTICFLVLLLLR